MLPPNSRPLNLPAFSTPHSFLPRRSWCWATPSRSEARCLKTLDSSNKFTILPSAIPSPVSPTTAASSTFSKTKPSAPTAPAVPSPYCFSILMVSKRLTTVTAISSAAVPSAVSPTFSGFISAPLTLPRDTAAMSSRWSSPNRRKTKRAASPIAFAKSSPPTMNRPASPRVSEAPSTAAMASASKNFFPRRTRISTQKKQNGESAPPPRSIPAAELPRLEGQSACAQLNLVAPSNRVAIGIHDVHRAEIQLANSGFHLGKVSDDDPHQPIRVQERFPRGGEIVCRQRPHLGCICRVVVVGQTILHDVLDRIADFGHGLSRTRQAKSSIVLVLIEFILRDGTRSEHVAQFFVDLDKRFFRFIRLHRRLRYPGAVAARKLKRRASAVRPVFILAQVHVYAPAKRSAHDVVPDSQRDLLRTVARRCDRSR